MRIDSIDELPPRIREIARKQIEEQNRKAAERLRGGSGKSDSGGDAVSEGGSVFAKKKKAAGTLVTGEGSGDFAADKKKYHNRVTVVDGIRFDSAREAERYTVLKLYLDTGQITKLKLQPEFTLTEAYMLPGGTRVRAMRYRADFSYIDADGREIVEDVKTEGTKTRVFVDKAKMVFEKYGIVIRLV